MNRFGFTTHPPICIWVDIAPKREKIKEMCIFPFAQLYICNAHIAKYRLTSTKCPRREEGKVRGSEEGRRRKKEEEEKMRKNVERKF